MKILILANNDIGLYKFRKELLKKLVECHKVYICLPEGEFIPKLKKMGCNYLPCEVLERHGTNPFKDIQLMLFYKKILKDIKPQIVFTYTIKPNIYGGMMCGYLNIPYIVNITGLGTAVENNGILQKITLMLYKLGLKKAKKVFFQNIENRDFMLNHNIINVPYDVLPGSGVNLSQYKLLEYPKEDIINFVFVARIMKEKGIEQYLDSAEYIRKKYPNTNFYVCGFCEDNYKEKLEEMNRKGIIVYHGLVSDMTAIYKKLPVLFIQLIIQKECQMFFWKVQQVEDQLLQQIEVDVERL